MAEEKRSTIQRAILGYEKEKLHYLDVLHGRLLGSLVNFHWQLGGKTTTNPAAPMIFHIVAQVI